MLEINHLTVKFGSRQVLRDVSISLRPNRLTAMVGRNGSGKSTLLSCVNQQLSYTGDIVLDDGDLADLSPRDRAKAVAILPQTLPAPRITAREMASFGRNPWLDFTGRLTGEDRKMVEEALKDADALELAERYVDTLSGGERQRVALAMILAQNTPIALLDEPTAHMDLKYEAAFLELLRRLREKREKTFLVVLHDLTLAVRYADDLIVLDEGRVVFSGSREECLERSVLEQVFGLRRYVLHSDRGERIFFTAE